jgi:hypothetical protein
MRQTKITTFVKFQPGEKIIGQELTNEFFKKLRYTLDDEGVSFLDREEDGENLCRGIFRRCLTLLPRSSPHLNLFARFARVGKFYENQILDTCDQLQHAEALYIFLPRISRDVFVSIGNLSSILSLFLANLSKESRKKTVLETLKTFIGYGLDPNTPLRKTHTISFEGDTVMGVLLQNSASFVSRAYIESLFRTRDIHMELPLIPYKMRDLFSHPVPYLTIALVTGPPRHIDDLTHLIFSKTPIHVVCENRDSPHNPVNLIMNMIRSPWDGYLFMSPPSMTILSTLIVRGVVPLSPELIWNLHMNNQFLTEVEEKIQTVLFSSPEPVYVNMIRHARATSLPLSETGLGILGGDVTEEKIKNARDSVVEKIESLCGDPGKPFINETFLNCDEVGSHRGFIFRAEDDYGFEVGEWKFLEESELNPYTRRVLSEEELYRLGLLTRLTREYWFLFGEEELPWISRMKKITFTPQEIIDEYVKRIDELIDESNLFPYGSRLRDVRERLRGKNLALFVVFIHNPLFFIPQELIDDFVLGCVPFSLQVSDSLEIHEVHAHFTGFITDFLANYMTIGDALLPVLSFVYTVLRLSLENFLGRVLTLNQVCETLLGDENP